MTGVEIGCDGIAAVIRKSRSSDFDVNVGVLRGQSDAFLQENNSGLVTGAAMTLDPASLTTLGSLGF